MKRIMGYAGRTILFTALLCLALAGAWKLTERKDSFRKYDDFMKQAKKGNIDVLFVGSSQIENGINTPRLYEDYGITAYNLGARGSTLQTSYWILRNALDYCTPKFVFIDCYMADRDYRYIDRMPETYDLQLRREAIGNFHDAIDAFPLNRTKWNTIRDVIAEPATRMEFYLDFLKYHSRWSELEQEDYAFLGGEKLPAIYGMGSRMVNRINTRAEETVLLPPAEKAAEHTVSMDYIARMTELCMQRGISPILLHLPFPADENMQRYANSVQDIADHYGVPYINMLYVPDLINSREDLCSQTHLSALGAAKVTDYLGEVMFSFGLADHRGDPSYREWDEAAERMHRELDEAEREQEITPETALMLLQLEESSYVVFINHGSRLLHDPYILGELDDITGKGEASAGIPYEYGDACLLVHDAVSGEDHLIPGSSQGEHMETSFGILTYISVAGEEGSCWNSLALEGNASVEEDQAENLLDYFNRSDVEMQIFYFDRVDGSLLYRMELHS